MSTTSQTADPPRSDDNFTLIFQAALAEYETVTGKLLRTDPFAREFDHCDSPQAISTVLRTQARPFSKFHNNDEKLMGWLDPIVHILFSFSATLQGVIGLKFPPAQAIFTAIGMLATTARDHIADHDKVIRLFESIHFFLQRLNSYIRTPLTREFTELLGKIMAQILSIIALSIKAMTEGRMKQFLKKLIRKSNIKEALLRLDYLTKFFEEETLMVADRVGSTIDQTVEVVEERAQMIEDRVGSAIDQTAEEVEERIRDQQRTQIQQELRAWLYPPNPSINHNAACDIQLDGSATWLIQSNKFREWKDTGALLWISGNPGVGKTILCSAIIEDIKNLRERTPALVAFYYFDYMDSSKRDVRGLLASLLFQLSGDSDRCLDLLYRLFKTCRDGAEQPSSSTLANCLKAMVGLPGQLPIFIIMDALNECPNNNGTPSAREHVLDFVEDFVGSSYSNLFMCVTSRPEQDIQTVLDPLTSASRRVALHGESGQQQDIYNYVRSFVYTDRAMRRWRDEDKQLVIETLSERASGMFRWAFCQLDALRRCHPSSIRRTLDELPTTLDETYERALFGIPKEKRYHAHRLFQCLVAAIRPLRAEELGEIFAIEFEESTTTNLREDWRLENPEEAILSTCSALITVIDYEGQKIIQFSHFSVKEFLTSDRLQTSETRNLCHYYVSLDSAHYILARACLTVLLRLDENIDKKRLTTFPLVLYAAEHWFLHAKYEGTESRVQDAMEQLFNPTSPYLAAWVWIYDAEWGRLRSVDRLSDLPRHPEASALYYAALFGLCGPVKYLISTHGEDVNAKCGFHGSPLHAASRNGHLDAVSHLLDYRANVNITNETKHTPLCTAYRSRHLTVMQLLLEREAAADVYYDRFGSLIHDASYRGHAEVIRLLLQHNANVNAVSDADRMPLHWASFKGHVDVTQILLEHGADVNAVSDYGTPLYYVSDEGRLKVVRLLLEHGADVHIRGPDCGTPFQVATKRGHAGVAQLLLEYGAEDKE